MKRPIIPDWFCVLRDDSLLNSRDVAAIFGYCSIEVLSKAVCLGAFPKPTNKEKKPIRKTAPFWGQPKNRLSWTKKEIIAEINRRNTKCADRQKL